MDFWILAFPPTPRASDGRGAGVTGEMYNNFSMIKDFPLNTLTTVKTGGKAKGLVIIKSLEELIEALRTYVGENYLIVGGGSNLIFPDSGYDGIIIKNEIQGFQLQDGTVTVQSGTPLQDLVDFTISNGLGELNKLTGIPGTVGGAIYGNAGAYGQTISDKLVSVQILRDGKLIDLPCKECEFDYRESIFKKTKEPIINAKFKLPKEDKSVLKQDSEEIFNLRLEKYPLGLKCPGSFFKNVPIKNVPANSLHLIPEDKVKHDRVHTGWLLETVEGKGLRVGGVEVAPYHANLLINKFNGTSEDFLRLSQELSKRVKDKYGIILEPEVQLISFPN